MQKRAGANYVLRQFRHILPGSNMALIDEKRAELEAVKKKGVSVFISALKKELDRLKSLGVIR